MTTLVVDGQPHRLAEPLPTARIGGTMGWLQQAVTRAEVLNLDLAGGGGLVVNTRSVLTLGVAP